MICLDTNYLIRCVEFGSDESGQLQSWFREGQLLLTSMPAWYEFMCGPITDDQERTVRAFLSDILPFGESEAREAARLFNVAGRKRSLRVDAMIAGTAIVAQTRLATDNYDDFAPFLKHGLELI